MENHHVEWEKLNMFISISLPEGTLKTLDIQFLEKLVDTANIDTSSKSLNNELQYFL